MMDTRTTPVEPRPNERGYRIDDGSMRREPAQRYAPSDRSIAGLSKELLRESEALARAEVALVRSEINEKIADVQKGVTAMIGGGATLAAGILMLLFAAVFALDLTLPLWLSALLVGAGATLIGAIAVLAGKRKVSPHNLMPNRSLEELGRVTGRAKEHAR